jgi:chromosome partitioning protein
MTTTILISAEKGGVGKSTTAVHLAAALADLGRRTLLIDLDPRGDLAMLLHQKPGRQCANWFLDDYSEPELSPGDVIVPTSRMHLDLVPGNAMLAGANATLQAAHIETNAVAARLTALAPGYEYLIVDANTTSGQLRDAALLAAQMLIIPTKAEYLGLNDIRSLLRAAMGTNTQARILPTFWNGHEVAQRQAMGIISTEWPSHLIGCGQGPLAVPERADMRTASMARQLIFEWEPKSAAAIAYRSLAHFVDGWGNDNNG